MKDDNVSTATISVCNRPLFAYKKVDKHLLKIDTYKSHNILK